MTLSEKQLQADFDHSSGLNCAQSVLKQFCDPQSLPLSAFLRLASGFGSGMKVGSVCGALSGGIMALGLLIGSENPARKAEMEAPVGELVSRFKAKMEHMECSNIIGVDITDPVQRAEARQQGIFQRQCPLAISTVVEIVEDILKQYQAG